MSPEEQNLRHNVRHNLILEIQRRDWSVDKFEKIYLKKLKEVYKKYGKKYIEGNEQIWIRNLLFREGGFITEEKVQAMGNTLGIWPNKLKEKTTGDIPYSVEMKEKIKEAKKKHEEELKRRRENHAKNKLEKERPKIAFLVEEKQPVKTVLEIAQERKEQGLPPIDYQRQQEIRRNFEIELERRRLEQQEKENAIKNQENIEKTILQANEMRQKLKRIYEQQAKIIKDMKYAGTKLVEVMEMVEKTDRAYSDDERSEMFWNLNTVKEIMKKVRKVYEELPR